MREPRLDDEAFARWSTHQIERATRGIYDHCLLNGAADADRLSYFCGLYEGVSTALWETTGEYLPAVIDVIAWCREWKRSEVASAS